ncbi:bifunctional diaminohydroxyphosphoribosylaminopyrimidine deaminase/5-amino-6-(5-phosphoribosylamino)uracil reductase RibD [Chloroflexota bacterium]
MAKLRDEDYMKLALRLARRGLGRTSPNPMVGAVIVKDNRIIGEGYHRYFGGKHAEINAIEQAGEDVAGATIYVTLEPCSHYGKTPPCVDAVIKHQLGRVVIGVLDPNPLVSGKSVKMLKEQGIAVTVGVLETDCRELNEAHFKYMSTRLPLVTLKFAQTLDGRIATATGSSRGLSSADAQRFVHRLRTVNDAIMVGVDTVIADDPRLTTRLVKGRSPLRIILDSRLRTPRQAKVLTDQEIAPTLIATTDKADSKKLAKIHALGMETITIKQNPQGELDLPQILEELGRRGISSVLVEGGAKVITSFLREKLADKLVVIIAPKIMGKGIEAVGELNIREVSESLKLSLTHTRRLGEDLVIEARIAQSDD